MAIRPMENVQVAYGNTRTGHHTKDAGRKGKPVARRGRNAYGPLEGGRVAEVEHYQRAKDVFRGHARGYVGGVERRNRQGRR